MVYKNMKNHSLVLDIGKTNIKLHVLDIEFESVFSKQMSNKVDYSGKYPCSNVTVIWDWLNSSIKQITDKFAIDKITVTTHGATCALIDRNKLSNNGLVLPILDYEYKKIHDDSIEYDDIRPNFSETFSPSLPCGLNLGRQLYWLKHTFPELFGQVTDILTYPQYWAWRFTGKLQGEITSLGCHTDLWSLKNHDYTSLVDQLECRELLPKLAPAWEHLGVVHEDLSETLGLEVNCKFYNGIHDSNASFLRYKITQKDNPFTVISTGTWTILMASGVSLDNLNPDKDMLANVDAFGSPVACARFMGGREFEAICEQTGSWLGEQFSQNDLQFIIDCGVFALPNFSDGSGPFADLEAKFVGAVDKASGIALATLYCALMMDYQLDNLESKGDIYIEGAFLKNPLMCGILQLLRKPQSVYMSLDDTGTVMGAFHLTHMDEEMNPIRVTEAPQLTIEGIEKYKLDWVRLLSNLSF